MGGAGPGEGAAAAAEDGASPDRRHRQLQQDLNVAFLSRFGDHRSRWWGPGLLAAPVDGKEAQAP